MGDDGELALAGNRQIVHVPGGNGKRSGAVGNGGSIGLVDGQFPVAAGIHLGGVLLTVERNGHRRAIGHASGDTADGQAIKNIRGAYPVVSFNRVKGDGAGAGIHREVNGLRWRRVALGIRYRYRQGLRAIVEARKRACGNRHGPATVCGDNAGYRVAVDGDAHLRARLCRHGSTGQAKAVAKLGNIKLVITGDGVDHDVRRGGIQRQAAVHGSDVARAIRCGDGPGAGAIWQRRKRRRRQRCLPDAIGKGRRVGHTVKGNRHACRIVGRGDADNLVHRYRRAVKRVRAVNGLNNNRWRGFVHGKRYRLRGGVACRIPYFYRHRCCAVRQAFQRAGRQRHGPVAVGINDADILLAVERRHHRLPCSRHVGRASHKLAYARFSLADGAIYKRLIHLQLRQVIDNDRKVVTVAHRACWRGRRGGDGRQAIIEIGQIFCADGNCPCAARPDLAGVGFAVEGQGNGGAFRQACAAAAHNKIFR